MQGVSGAIVRSGRQHLNGRAAADCNSAAPNGIASATTIRDGTYHKPVRRIGMPRGYVRFPSDSVAKVENCRATN
jgi:hypothetical protein